MPGIDPRRLTGIVVEALVRSGQRGVLATGGGALAGEEMPAQVKVIVEAPHHKLFPLVAGAIHHGGAGTSGAVLRAGLPAAICPFFGDQPFWARRLAELGVAPPPLDRRTLSVDAMVAAIKALNDPNIRNRAAAIGRLIRKENGVATAATFIDGGQAGAGN
jgi:UDP:flavonoid glycosyltransferase YjiC (YdhE family)